MRKSTALQDINALTIINVEVKHNKIMSMLHV